MDEMVENSSLNPSHGLFAQQGFKCMRTKCAHNNGECAENPSSEQYPFIQFVCRKIAVNGLYDNACK